MPKKSETPYVYVKTRVRGKRTVFIGRYLDPWKDPTCRKYTEVTLDNEGVKTAKQAQSWRKAMSRAVLERMRQLSVGEVVVERKTLDHAIDEYLAHCETRLATSTVAVYRESLDILKTWAQIEGVVYLDHLTKRALVVFREWLIESPRRVPAKGPGNRGKRVKGAGRRSTATVNKWTRTVSAFLEHWRRHEVISLTREDVKDALRRLPQDQPQPRVFASHELQSILRAARASDDWTRDPEKGKRSKGKPRKAPLAPVVLFVMLTGCRVNEAVSLLWDRVSADAIRLKVEDTKTRQARTIWLSVSPALSALLDALREQSQGNPHVFGWSSRSEDGRLNHHARTYSSVDNGRKNLHTIYGAPRFSWDDLRENCASHLSNAPGIWGDAAATRSAKQLGHSIAVAERHYLGVIRDIDPDARTLEEAMGISEEAWSVVDAVRASST